MRIHFVLFLMVLMNSNLSIAGEDMRDFCEKEILLLRQSQANVADKIKLCENLGAKCKGTGFYEYELGKLYMIAGDYDKAKKVMDEGYKNSEFFKKELLLGCGDIYLHKKDYAMAEKIYKQVVDDYPGWFAGFHALGFVMFAQGRFDNAIVNLNKANTLHPQSRTFNYLTLAYYSVGEYQKAVDSLNEAFQIDREILADRDAMVAGSRCYAELGKFEISKNLLAMLLRNRPDLKEDEEFIKAGLYLRQKMVEGGFLEE